MLEFWFVSSCATELSLSCRHIYIYIYIHYIIFYFTGRLLLTLITETHIKASCCLKTQQQNKNIQDYNFALGSVWGCEKGHAVA
jgi:hypothetical protein